MNFLCCKEARGTNYCFQYFFQGKKKVSEHLPCNAPQPGATKHSSATPTGQQQTLLVSHTTCGSPCQDEPAACLAGSQNGGRGAPLKACGTGIATLGTPQAGPSQCHPLAALTLAAQSQPRQLPVRELVTEIHNPDGDIHLEEQSWELPHSSHRITPQLHEENLYLGGNGLFWATPVPQSPSFPIQGWAEIPSSSIPLLLWPRIHTNLGFLQFKFFNVTCNSTCLFRQRCYV